LQGPNFFSFYQFIKKYVYINVRTSLRNVFRVSKKTKYFLKLKCTYEKLKSKNLKTLYKNIYKLTYK